MKELKESQKKVKELEEELKESRRKMKALEADRSELKNDESNQEINNNVVMLSSKLHLDTDRLPENQATSCDSGIGFRSFQEQN